MSALAVVALDPKASAAFGLPTKSPAGRFWLTDDGQALRVEPDGRIEQLIRGGSPWGRSLASDPCAHRSIP